MMIELIVRIIILILSIVAFGLSVTELFYLIAWEKELNEYIKKLRGEEDGETV